MPKKTKYKNFKAFTFGVPWGHGPKAASDKNFLEFDFFFFGGGGYFMQKWSFSIFRIGPPCLDLKILGLSQKIKIPLPIFHPWELYQRSIMATIYSAAKFFSVFVSESHFLLAYTNT